MNDEEKDEISPKLEELNSKDGEVKIESLSIEQSIKEVTKEKKGCYFPSAHLILLILEIIIFILTYVIPKGKYDGLKYFEEGDKFIVYKYELNGTVTEIVERATQETLDYYNISIPLENFKNGYVKDDVAVPNSYKKLTEAPQEPFYKVLMYPILGLIDCADIAFFLMMIAGCLNVLIEMKSFLAAMEVLSRCGKNSGIILLVVVYFILSIGGSALGFEEQILAFYPALMPAYIKCGIDGALAAASIYFGSIVGNMFSTINPFGTVIGSYLAGVNFMDGIVFRVVAFVVGDAIVIGYFVFYHIRVTKYPEKSVVYEIREQIRNKVLKEEEENGEGKKEDEYTLNNLDDDDEEAKLKQEKLKRVEFTWIQKISLILFLITFNLTLDQGLIEDTVLHGLSSLVEGMSKIAFAIILLVVYIILGFFIQNGTGLAVLSIPIFSPLCDQVNCSKNVLVNAFMYGQNMIEFISPTGLSLIVSQIVGMTYSHWVKFVWKVMIPLFILLIVLVILDAVIEINESAINKKTI